MDTPAIATMLYVKNNGPLIEETNYWDSPLAIAGKLLLSVNAGCFRLLLPPTWEEQLPDITRNVSHVVISRSDYLQSHGFVLEILFEDGSESPYSFQLSAGQIFPMPAKSDARRRFKFAIYVNQGGTRCVYETDAYFQVVPRLPWLKSINPKHFR
jgi:hypothetical protein